MIGIVDEKMELDEKTLPKVNMPNRDGFVSDPRAARVQGQRQSLREFGGSPRFCISIMTAMSPILDKAPGNHSTSAIDSWFIDGALHQIPA
jgi:hypothetical protein